MVALHPVYCRVNFNLHTGYLHLIPHARDQSPTRADTTGANGSGADHRLNPEKKELTHQRDELQKTLDQNLKLENFKEALISMIVHDLKNPLNGIIGLSSLNEPEYLERIHNVSQQMLYMVENILDVRKYENHSLKIFHQQTDIREVVEEAIGDVNFLITDNNIQIVNTMDHIITSFDRDIIKRVYVNLLTNAIKFSPTRGTITLEGSYRMVSDQKQLILSIKDQEKAFPKSFRKISLIFTSKSKSKVRQSNIHWFGP